jgi:hypothetical protein
MERLRFAPMMRWTGDPDHPVSADDRRAPVTVRSAAGDAQDDMDRPVFVRGSNDP